MCVCVCVCNFVCSILFLIPFCLGWGGGGGGRLAGEVMESAFGPSDEVKNVTTSFRVTKDVWHCKSLEGHMTKFRFR